MILHSLSAAPDSNAYRDCLQLLGKGDALLLLADGVYAALADSKAYIDMLNSGAELFLLQPDAAAAGILHSTGERITPVDFDAFAELTERFVKQQAWY